MLLFYRYFLKEPRLAGVSRASDLQQLIQPFSVAEFYSQLCSSLDMTGKIRIAHEGLNITVAGSNESISEFITKASQHDTLVDLKLAMDPDAQLQFFKPSPGCKHVFDDLSVKVVEEICPFGVPGYVPRVWMAGERGLDSGGSVDLTAGPVAGVSGGSLPQVPEEVSLPGGERTEAGVFPECPAAACTRNGGVTYLQPAEFHEILSSAAQDDVVVLDARNYYESMLGQFSNAICPAIRKFSTLPQWLQAQAASFRDKRVLSYCTGGVRCEKAAAYLSELLGPDAREAATLEGGIHNYLAWVDTQWQAGRAVAPVFHGRNYVFDARQSLGLATGPGTAAAAVAEDRLGGPGGAGPRDSVAADAGLHRDSRLVTLACCRLCDASSSNYVKCAGTGCHLIVVACLPCQEKAQAPNPSIFCCAECAARSTALSCSDGPTPRPRPGLCACERQRRSRLEGELAPLRQAPEAGPAAPASRDTGVP